MQKIIADLHLHSKYSRATSPQMDLTGVAKWAKIKGVNLVGTADFTHPLWFRVLFAQLEEASEGLYKLKGKKESPFFILSSEIACIYKDMGATRRIHLNILMPSLVSVKKLNERLVKIGNIHSDGRPILGITAHALAKLALVIDARALIIPAHIWTPWFSIYGSKSGYDSIDDCFKELTPQILAVETGLSADPQMCWRVSELDNFAIVSSGDSHSLPNLAREATVFEITNGDKLSFNLIRKMLGEGSAKARQRQATRFASPQGGQMGGSVQVSSQTKPSKTRSSHLAYTIEFFPEEGKYHLSGHRKCQYKTDHCGQDTRHEKQGTSLFGRQANKSEIRNPKNNNIAISNIQNLKSDLCPICHKPLTLGVMYRVNQLADRPVGFKPRRAAPYKSLVQLDQIISESIGVGEKSLAVQKIYHQMIKNFGPELFILEDLALTELKNKFDEKIIDGIERVRKADIYIDPGYDGEYGKVKIFQKFTSGQKMLF